MTGSDARITGNTHGSAPALPTFQSVMRDIARLTYADHVRLAEALNHSPQVLNDLVGKWAQGITFSPASTMDVATAMSRTPAYRGYFKESADG